MYVAVSTIAATSIAALGVEAGTTTLTIDAIATVADCIGAVMAAAVIPAVAGEADGWKTLLGNKVTDCIADPIDPDLPTKQLATQLGTDIRTAIGAASPAVVGEAIGKAATEANMKLDALSAVGLAAADALSAS